MNSSRYSSVLVVMLSVLLASPNAWADPGKAAEYYKQASEAYAAGRLQEAADLLERAFAEEPDLVYQYNRILAFEGLNDFDAALRLVDIYKDPMLRDPDNRFSDIATIEQRLKDGKEVARLKAQVEEEERLKREEEEKKNAELKTPPDPEPKDSDEAGPNWVAISLVSAGVVSLGAGGLFASGLLVSDELDSTKCVNDNLSAGSAGDAIFQNCDAYAGMISYDARANQYADDKSAIETQQLMSIVFLSAGAVLATSGVLVWVLSDSSEANASLFPVVGADRAGAGLNVNF